MKNQNIPTLINFKEAFLMSPLRVIYGECRQMDQYSFAFMNDNGSSLGSLYIENVIKQLPLKKSPINFYIFYEKRKIFVSIRVKNDFPELNIFYKFIAYIYNEDFVSKVEGVTYYELPL